MGTEPQRHSLSLRDYLRVLRRRKWLVIQAVVLVPAAAVAISLRQQHLYQASSEVLLSRQNLAAALTNTQDQSLSQDPNRLVQTQASLARVPAVAERVLKATHVSDRTAEDFLASSTASANPSADLLEFTVTDPKPALATSLASAYARQFTIYRRGLDTAALHRARTELEVRLKALETAGDRQSALYASLIDKDQQLRTIEALQTANSFVVRSGDRAKQVQPRPFRNGLLGLGLGIIFGIGLAFLWETLDTRVRSAEEIADRLGLPLLARVPAPPRRLRNENRLVMLAKPAGIHAEAFRMLRTNLEFANLERGARTIMVSSSVETEGKSTTIANLAVALARAGKRVALVDLDLRRPFLARLFALDTARPGLTDVALGHAELDDVIARVAISTGSVGGAATNGKGRVEGVLEVLPSGPAPPDAGEFVATKAVGDILDRLAERADIVLIDAPPLLHVGDAMTLSARIDAIFVVTRMNVVRRHMLAELRRLLEACPADRIGFVLTDAHLEEAYSYASYAGYYKQHAYAEVESVKERIR
jgi:succinoglycan biosynthesis transport protein ExoP